MNTIILITRNQNRYYFLYKLFICDFIKLKTCIDLYSYQLSIMYTLIIIPICVYNMFL